MARRDRDVEIIELLPPDHDDTAFLPGSITTTADEASIPPSPEADERHARLPLILGVVAVVAVVVVAVLASNGTDGRSAVPTTTAASPRPVTSTTRLDPTPDALPGGHFVLDDPSLVPYSADVVAPPNDGRFYELWSVGGPDTPWLSVEAKRGDLPDVSFSESSRHLVDGVEVIDAYRSGTATVVRQVNSGWWVTVRATGLPDTQLVDFATKLDIVHGRIEDRSGVLVSQRMQSVAQASSPDEVVFGTVQGESRYALAHDGGMVTLDVAAPTGLAVRVDHLHYFVDSSYTDSNGRIGGVLRDSGEAIVSWFERGARFTLTGRMQVDSLASLADHLKPVTDDEWRGRVYGLHPDYRLGPFTVNGGGSASDGSKWAAGVQTATRGGRTWFLWWWTVPHHPERSSSMTVPGDLHESAWSDSVVVQGATYVFASVPGPLQTVPVTVRGGDGKIQAIAMKPVKGDTILVGVARIDAPGEVTVTFGQ